MDGNWVQGDFISGLMMPPIAASFKDKIDFSRFPPGPQNRLSRPSEMVSVRFSQLSREPPFS
jgi:hypothetical protein